MGKKIRIDLDKEQLVKLREEGKEVEEIAQYFNTTKKVVQNNIKRYGLQKGNKKDVDVDLLKKYFDAGVSIVNICEKLNVGKCVVYRYVKELGLKRSQEEINQNRKQTILRICDGDLDGYYSNIANKQYKTWQGKTGLENPYNNPEMKERRKQTCLEKYGCENPMQLDDIKNKAFETNMERYGCKTPFQSEEVREKARQNYFKKTGYYSPSQNPEIQEFKRVNNLKKYGVENPKQLLLNEKAKSVLLTKEGFKEYLNTCGLKTTSDIANDLGVADSTIVKTAAKFDLKGYAIVNTSKGELDVAELINSFGVKTTHDRCNILPHNEIDIYCPDYKIAVEYNGIYWHSDINIKSRLYHYNKSKDCEKQGIRLIHVYEDEWNDPVKKEIIKSLLKVAFGKVDSRIYARQCEIKEITNKEAKPFNNKNHIQGHRNAQITYGLYHNDELVQLMSFSWNKHYQAWEIIRGCPGSNNIVVGGVSKLFKHFIKEKNPDKIFSYCDFNKFNGVGYEAIGMKFVGETKYNKWYVINGKRYERNPSKYREYNEMKECIVYGAGSKKYLWEKQPEIKSN